LEIEYPDRDAALAAYAEAMEIKPYAPDPGRRADAQGAVSMGATRA